MDNPVNGTDGKLGRGFMSADKLEEVDIGNGDKPRPTFISVLTVYFGAPSMFITLWFGFDYGTNPPLGTLII
jgi:hypothetical protein